MLVIIQKFISLKYVSHAAWCIVVNVVTRHVPSLVSLYSVFYFFQHNNPSHSWSYWYCCLYDKKREWNTVKTSFKHLWNSNYGHIYFQFKIYVIIIIMDIELTIWNRSMNFSTFYLLLNLVPFRLMNWIDSNR